MLLNLLSEDAQKYLDMFRKHGGMIIDKLSSCIKISVGFKIITVLEGFC